MSPKPDRPELNEDDFVHALREMNTVVDVAVEDLVELYGLACKYSEIRYAESAIVADLMTRPVITTAPDRTLAEAARMFLLHNIDAMPVVGASGNLLGMISESDLLTSLGLPCHGPGCSLWHRLERIFSDHRHIQGLAGKVEDVMSTVPVTVSPRDTLHDAIETMQKGRVKKLIVTDDTGCIVGILTRSNVVKAFLAAGTPTDGSL